MNSWVKDSNLAKDYDVKIGLLTHQNRDLNGTSPLMRRRARRFSVFPMEVRRMLTNLDALKAPTEAPTKETANPILKFRRPSQDGSAERTVPPPTRAQRFYSPIRRLLDFTVALLLTLLALPVVLLAALAVRLT